MKVRVLLIGICLIVFILLASYFATNMASFDKKSNDCVSQGGKCIDADEGCASNGLMPHPDAECYTDDEMNVEIDGSYVCCIRY